MRSLPPTLPSFSDVLDARRAVNGHLNRTPLYRHTGLCDQVGADVFVKHENFCPTGAFKVRGGINLATRLTAAEREGGLYTASTGNHGQSIAYAGSVTGTPVTVAVPEGANPQKVEAMRSLGARVLFHGPDFDSAREWIAEQAQREGGRFIGPTDPELIAGVATYSLEILEDLPDVEVILVPVGAGSGSCGACLVGKQINPRLRVIGVQAERASAVHDSWQAGRLVESPMATRAEGLATRVAFENAMAILNDPARGLDDFVLVSDEAMEDAIGLLLKHTRSVAEHAGAATLAAALSRREELAGRKIAIVLSGGNLSLDDLTRIAGGRGPGVEAARWRSA